MTVFQMISARGSSGLIHTVVPLDEELERNSCNLDTKLHTKN